MFLKNTYRTAGLPETFNAIEEILGTTDPYQSEYDASIREETRPISPLLIDDANVEDMAATGKAWVKDIESASRDLVQQSADGDRDNMMFLPRSRQSTIISWRRKHLQRFKNTKITTSNENR
ncbi:hypothetical protein PPYR_02415 [Photinus pyralis]|uniref:Uncharacterized protein n=1 Tax=Photinus pyralis TaxID=7054 RepID=A0A5N4B766_PHOPY|nr:hypothetical protein PPYR_02415 [Photinus pyralis]